MLPFWFLVTIVMVRMIAICAMVSAGLPIGGVLGTLHHVTTPPPSTLPTPSCVETPHSGEDFLVTCTIMDHCGASAEDVTAPCKHVPAFGIFMSTDINPLNISPGPGAKTARTRSLD